MSLLDTECDTEAVPDATPVTVTVCGVDQLTAVNVNTPAVPAATVAVATGDDDTDTDTSPVGSESNTTVYDASPPTAASTNNRLTDTPAVSSSVIVTVAVLAYRWFIARVALGADGLTAAALVALELLLELLVYMGAARLL